MEPSAQRKAAAKLGQARKPKPRKQPGLAIVDAKFAFAFTKTSEAPETNLSEVAFAGRSNVGKSSLLNTLMARRNLVRTSSTPGCTRQINVFEAKFRDALAIHFADLPGFGYARRSKTERIQWGAMMEDYFRQRSQLSLLVILVDIRRGPEQLEQDLVEFLASIRQDPVPIVWVATKLDKLGRASIKLALDKITRQVGDKVIGFSAKTGQGRDQLCAAILQALPSSRSQRPSRPSRPIQPWQSPKPETIQERTATTQCQSIRSTESTSGSKEGTD